MNQSSKHALIAILITLLITLNVRQPVLQAASSLPTATLPTGGTFTAGSGNIGTAGNILTINQNSLNGIINWNTFSIGQASSVNFKNGSGATLNKVTGVTPTSILGRLLATGSIYLLNPQGILIGHGATIHTGGDFLATTLTLPNSAFLSNAPLTFSGSSSATVVNLGDLTSTGGNIYLIGHTVQNAGTITSPNGTAGLAAGGQVLITDSSNNQKVAVQAPGGDVTNSGFINAAQAELKSNGGNIYALAGNTGGQIQATGTATQDGHIWLIATHGTTNVAGLLSATNADGTGGDIETSGEHLDISKATIKTGRSGNWLIDPVDLTIDSTAATTIDTALNGSTSVTLQTTATTASGPGNQTAGAGDINIDAPISWSANNTLTLDAYHGVSVFSPITASNPSAALTIKYNDGGAGGYFTAYAPITLAPTGSLSINNSPYTLISNSTDLQNLPLSGHFALNADLDLTQLSFLPIGYSSSFNNAAPTPFSGVFEGLGHTLTNLTISTPSAYKLGLFSYIATGSIVENLTLAGGSVTLGAALDSAGMLAGRSEGFIYNVGTSGTVNGSFGSQYLGGLIGYSTGTLLNDFSTGAVIGGDNAVSTGGLVGTNFGSIWNSYASGAVTTGMGSLDTGGLVGTNSGSINGSYATGPVTSGQGSIATGGLAGSSAGPIADSYSTGLVTTGNASNSTGGLVGLNTLTSITSSFATGDLVVGSNSSIAGGLVGQNVLGSITASYATGSLQGGGGQEFGGFAGSSSGTVAASYATGGVTSSGSNAGYIGGFIGINANAGSIQQSYSTGTITAPSAQWVGGLVGLNQAAISDSYATGPVTVAGGTSIGGLVGYNAALATIANSYSTGAVTGGLNPSVGGLVGSNALSALTNVTSSFWDTVTSGQSQSLGGTGLTTAQWFSLGPLAISAPSWDFTSTWVQGYPYPVLKQLPYVVSTLSSASRSYGAANPTPAAASILDQNGNDASSRISGTPTMVGASSSSNVGSYSVAATGQTVSGGYQLTYIPTTLTITPAQLTGSVSAGNKVYDGTTAASATIVLTGVVGSDNISVTGATYSFASKNVGTGLAVSQTGGVLSGASNLLNDYQLVSISSGSANITPLTLTVGGTTLAASKTYDGTAAAAISGGSIGAVISGDTVSFTQTGSFNDKNAAVGKTVTYTNQLSGADAPNYSLSSNGGTLLASITPLTLTVGGTTLAASKVYDSTTAAGVTGGSISAISGDVVGLLQSGTFNNKNAGLGKTVTYTNSLSGTDAANYSLSSTGGTLTADITPLALTVGGTTLVTTKVYDGNTSATVSGGSINSFSGDSVNFSQSGTFDNKNVGLGKTVTYNNQLSGTDAANYSLSSSGGTTTGNITPLTLTVGGTTLASSKAYDGTTQVSITGGSISSPISGDLVSFTQAGAFSDKNAGVNKTVNYSNLLSGPDSGNYLLSSSGGTITATITPLTLTVGGTTIAANKVYDGTTFAAISGGSVSSVLTGDLVNFSQSGAFSDKNVGNGKTVTYSNLLSGLDAGNYLLSSAGGTTTANITPAQLTATFVASNKVYDGSTTATASVSSLNGVIGSDAVSLSATPSFNFSDQNAGTGKTVSASAVTLAGIDAGNYTFALNESGTASIIPAQLTYVANTGISRPYGSANPAFSGTVTGLVPGDTLVNATTGTAAFTSPATALSAPGTYAINGSGLTANHGNYLFTQALGNATALSVIGALNFAINSATGVVGQVPTFTATYTGPAINGLNISSLLAGLTYQITPALNGPGTYKVTATSTAPSGFVFNIAPGTFTIIDNSPAVLPSSAPLLSPAVPALFSNAAAASADFLQPANSLGLFQVDSSSPAFAPQQQQPALSQSTFFTGTNNQNEKFAAGAKP